jgi:hypothetical protein
MLPKGKNYSKKNKGAKGRCDILFSKIVRHKANGQCENPACPYRDKGYRLECAHIFGRSYSATRIDFDNALALCAGCHRMFHSRPIDFAELVKHHLGLIRYEQLRAKAVAGTKVDWEAELDVLQAIWEQMEDA